MKGPKKIKAGPLRVKGLVKTMWAGPKALTGLERSAGKDNGLWQAGPLISAGLVKGWPIDIHGLVGPGLWACMGRPANRQDRKSVV